VILSAGARFDHYSGLGNSANPRVGLIYRPWDRTTLKFLYGQAFRVPSLYELYYAYGTSPEGKPLLNPETIHTTEVNAEQYFTKHTSVLVAGFYNSIGDLITGEFIPQGCRHHS
jgi:iron complex outermembrane receptor protein